MERNLVFSINSLLDYLWDYLGVFRKKDVDITITIKEAKAIQVFLTSLKNRHIDPFSPEVKIKFSPDIRNLNLDGSILGKEAVALIAKALIGNTTIHTLRLSNAKLGDEATVMLTQALVDNTTLKVLDLNNNGITSKAAKYLSQLNVETLWLTNNSLGDNGARELAHGRFNALFLAMNGITDRGAKALANYNKGLTQLSLSANRIGCKGAAEFVHHPTLKRLNLSRNKIKDEGAKALSITWHALEELNLSFNLITGKGVRHLVHLNGNVQELNLSGNFIGKEAALFRNNATLIKLGLSALNVDPAQEFPRAFDDNPTQMQVCNTLINHSQDTLSVVDFKNNLSDKEIRKVNFKLNSSRSRTGVCFLFDKRDESSCQNNGNKEGYSFSNKGIGQNRP